MRLPSSTTISLTLLLLVGSTLTAWSAKTTKAKQAPPAATSGLGAPAPQRILTLDEVLAIALHNNSNVTLAQERLLKAQELIEQAEAEGKPQVSAALTDTLSSVRSFGSAAGGSTFTPSLPGGGAIPVVIDTGGGTTGGFVGGGGGGTTSSTGQSGNGIGGGSANTGTSTTTPTNNGTGSGSGTTGTGATTSGTSSTGSSAITPANGLAMAAALPAIVQQFGSATGDSASITPASSHGGTSSITPAKAHDDTTGGTGTGNPTTTNTFSNNGGGNFNNYGGRITVTQYLDIFNLVGSAKAVERITRDFYALDLDRVSNETALSVKTTFFNVLLAQTQVSVQQEQVRYATENVRIAQARFNAGASAQFDVVTAQTTLSNAQQQLISAQNQLALTQANLNNIIGVSQAGQLNLQAPPLPASVSPDISQSLQTAYTHRPELQQAENNIAIAQRLIKLADATLKPSLSLVGSGVYTGTTSTSTSRKDTYSISAQLGIPLYDGGTTKSRVRSAQVDLDTQMVTRGQLRQNVELEVRQAIISVNNAEAQTAATTQGVTQAEEAVRLAQVRYQNGFGTFLEVTNAQAQLAQARTNQATAQFSVQTALAQLTRAEGGR